MNEGLELSILDDIYLSSEPLRSESYTTQLASTVNKTVSSRKKFQLRELGTVEMPLFGQTSPSLEVHHASPLAPLKVRDAEALDAFFDSDRVREITLDVHRYLARTYPEPCWEDEPYEFLKGYV